MDFKIAVTLILIGAVVGTGIIAYDKIYELAWEKTDKNGMANPRFTVPELDVEVAPVEMVAL